MTPLRQSSPSGPLVEMTLKSLAFPASLSGGIPYTPVASAETGHKKADSGKLARPGSLGGGPAKASSPTPHMAAREGEERPSQWAVQELIGPSGESTPRFQEKLQKGMVL